MSVSVIDSLARNRSRIRSSPLIDSGLFVTVASVLVLSSGVSMTADTTRTSSRLATMAHGRLALARQPFG